MIKIILIPLCLLFLIGLHKAGSSSLNGSYEFGTDTGKYKHIHVRPKALLSYEDWFRNHYAENNCTLTTRYTVAQRLKKYPFLKAAKILAVSFPYVGPHGDIDRGDTVRIGDTIRSDIFKIKIMLAKKFPAEIVYRAGLHIDSGKLNHTSLIELKELNQKQINKLTNIIYNTKARKPTHFWPPGATCYSPRNALVFIDRNGKVFDYFAICFECKQFRSQSDRITMGSYCNQKFDLMKSFFEGIGIEFGTKEQESWN